jgi:2-polyprenyl-3-methyl-5-hydroxy-6-metoxy-1,4-benzoquinol methylase
MERIPSEEELNSHYSAYSYNNEISLSQLTIQSYNAILDEFEKYRQNNRILDVGCGRGFFLEEARKRGWEVYGTEYSQRAIELLQSKGINTCEGRIDKNTFQGASFDIITSFEVIEHINNPNEDLPHIHNKLRSGGLLYVTTPNFNSLMRYALKAKYNIIEYPEHLTYFTKKTLNRTVCRHGFRNIKFLSTGISISRFEQSVSGQGSGASSDEKLRKVLSSNALMSMVKRFLNSMLTIGNLGITLKGYYVKK